MVWVLGSPRSGTTWLGTQLLSHDTKILKEPGISEHLGISVWAITDKIIRNIDYRKNIPNYFFSESHKETWLYFLRKLILNRIYAQFLNLNSVIIIKEPMRMWASDIISECLPDSKIIFLVRDGRDIIDSQMDARKTNAWMVERGLSPLKENERNEFIKYQSERYTKLVENILETCEKHSKNKTYLIKYEDLLSNTYKELKKLYEFISVSTTDKEIKDIVEKYTFKNIPSEEKGEGKFFRAANPGKWRESFNENETKEMNSIMKNILSQLNYSIK